MTKRYVYTLLTGSSLLFTACSTGTSPILDGADASYAPNPSYSAYVQSSATQRAKMKQKKVMLNSVASMGMQEAPEFYTERYSKIEENGFKATTTSPLSTLSIDVDTASYTNVVRMIEREDRFPESGAVRIEEMINYFNYDYPQPAENAVHPFTITTELSNAPWNTKNKLMLVGLQAKTIAKEKLPPSNFVALVDVSGSMDEDLPLVKRSLKLLAKKLDKNDRLSIVNYATDIGITLEPTPGNEHKAIENAVDTLVSYGGTNGEAGIEIAYELARKTFMPNGNNRVIMFTDGDFNVGKTSESDIVEIVEKERESGIYLSIAGFGYGNLNDSTMEQMADNGNGNYSYINDLLDAKKTFDSELTGTLYTLGKDVKFQIEFNPSVIGSYRLIGYENRLLNAEDFNDDTKDAGEIGVGHRVTALYELTMASDDQNSTPSVDPLKYQKNIANGDHSELATVKMRYKQPDGNTSTLMSSTVANTDHSTSNLDFASCVAGFGMILRDSKFKGTMTYADVIERAKASKGSDEEGYRAGFIKLVQKAELLAQ